MPVTNYHTVNDHLIGETTSGTRTDYLTDALGSVTATVDSSAVVVNTYRYKPYGAQLAKTGVGADPKFGWNGSTHWRVSAVIYADYYLVSKHYGAAQAEWTSGCAVSASTPLYRLTSHQLMGSFQGAGSSKTTNDTMAQEWPGSPEGPGSGSGPFKDMLLRDGSAHKPGPGGIRNGLAQECHYARNCIWALEHGYTEPCRPKDPDCHKLGTYHRICCIHHRPRKGRNHILVFAIVEFHQYICYFVNCGSPGQTQPFGVPTGRYQIWRSKDGGYRKCRLQSP